MLLVVVAGVLAIWALGLQSDLDDQRDQTAQAQAQAEQASKEVDSLSGQIDQISQSVSDAGAELSQTLVPRRLRSEPGRWRRWDWANDRPGAQEHVPPGGALIVEGCGAFAAGASARSALRIWVDAPDALRRRRALDRDGGAYDPYWDMWDRQWRRYVHRTAPTARADVRLRAAPDGRTEPGPDAGAAAVHVGSRGLT